MYIWKHWNKTLNTLARLITQSPQHATRASHSLLWRCLYTLQDTYAIHVAPHKVTLCHLRNHTTKVRNTWQRHSVFPVWNNWPMYTTHYSITVYQISEDTTKDASGIYVLKSESYNTISNKWLWHYWRSQECMSTQAHQQFLCQQTLPTKCVNYFWDNKSYLNKECRHTLYQKNYVSKFCRVSPTIKQRQQIVSHQIRSTNYISTNSVNKFCQPTPIINYVAQTSQLSTT